MLSLLQSCEKASTLSGSADGDFLVKSVALFVMKNSEPIDRVRAPAALSIAIIILINTFKHANCLPLKLKRLLYYPLTKKNL